MIKSVISIDSSVTTNIGQMRLNNEDNFYVNGSYIHKDENSSNINVSISESNNEFIFAVCDGMGGEKCGEEASFIAVSELKAFHDKLISGISYDDINSMIQLFNNYIERTNHLICGYPFENGYKMGTTLAAVLVFNNQAVGLNLGDSRIYMHRDKTLTQLTADHTEAERLIRLGVLTRQSAKNHKSRYQLYRHLGVSEDNGKLEADVTGIISLNQKDIFLICSDGLTDMVDDDKICEIFSTNTEANIMANLLVNQAIKNGGTDNITAMVIKITNIA